jgi:hypothetical protein
MSELRSFYGGSNTFDNLGREIPNTDGYIRGNVGEGMVRQVNDSRAQYNEAIADINARERTFDVRIMDNDS